MRWTNKGHQFDAAADRLLAADTQFLVWGTGVNGQAIIREYQDKINILGCIDSNNATPISLRGGQNCPFVSRILI